MTIADPPSGDASAAWSATAFLASSQRRRASAGDAAWFWILRPTNEQQQMHPSMHLAQPRWNRCRSLPSQRSCSACRQSARSTSLRASQNAWMRPRAPPSPPKRPLSARAALSFRDSRRASASATAAGAAPAALSCSTSAAAASAAAAASRAAAAGASSPSGGGGAPPATLLHRARGRAQVTTRHDAHDGAGPLEDALEERLELGRLPQMLGQARRRDGVVVRRRVLRRGADGLGGLLVVRVDDSVRRPVAEVQRQNREPELPRRRVALAAHDVLERDAVEPRRPGPAPARAFDLDLADGLAVFAGAFEFLAFSCIYRLATSINLE